MEVQKHRNASWEKQALINGIKQGQELAKQLQNLLSLTSTTSISETHHFLVENIISSYEITLNKLNTSTLSSSCSDHGSTPQDYKNKTCRGRSKKRKVLPKWTDQVRVQSDTGLEGPLDDGYSWRKYGQKDIHDAIHPRGYYRCKNRDSQGCLAMRQVQRSNQDPTIFHITYIGHHTCTKSKQLINVNTQLQLPNTEINEPISSPGQVKLQAPRKIDQMNYQVRFSFRTDNEEGTPAVQMFPTFSPFTSTSGSNSYGNVFISSAETDDTGQFTSSPEGSLLPMYIYPATSESEFYLPSHASELGLSHHDMDCWDPDLAGSRSTLDSEGVAMDFGSEFLCSAFDFE